MLHGDLSHLSLWGTPRLTLRNFELIPNLRCLSYVNLRGTTFNDDSVRHLNRLPMLEMLDISKTQVSDAGLSHLVRPIIAESGSGLQNLKMLNLSYLPSVTEIGFEHLNHFPELYWLDTSYSGIEIRKIKNFAQNWALLHPATPLFLPNPSYVVTSLYANAAKPVYKNSPYEPNFFQSQYSKLQAHGDREDFLSTLDSLLAFAHWDWDRTEMAQPSSRSAARCAELTEQSVGADNCAYHYVTYDLHQATGTLSRNRMDHLDMSAKAKETNAISKEVKLLRKRNMMVRNEPKRKFTGVPLSRDRPQLKVKKRKPDSKAQESPVVPSSSSISTSAISSTPSSEPTLQTSFMDVFYSSQPTKAIQAPLLESFKSKFGTSRQNPFLKSNLPLSSTSSSMSHSSSRSSMCQTINLQKPSLSSSLSATTASTQLSTQKKSLAQKQKLEEPTSKPLVPSFSIFKPNSAYSRTPTSKNNVALKKKSLAVNNTKQTTLGAFLKKDR